MSGFESSGALDEVNNLPGSRAGLVSGDYLWRALRRGRRLIALGALTGLLLAGAFLVLVPRAHVAKATILLSHDPQVDPARALDTDLALFTTRTVALKTIDSLGVAMTPESLMKTITIEPGNSDVVGLKLAARSDGEALRRMNAYIDAYLSVREEQITTSSRELIDSLNARVAALNKQVATLSTQIDGLQSANDFGASRLTDLLQQRSARNVQVDTLQQGIEEEKQRIASVVEGTKVIDTPAIQPPKVALRLVQGLISGLVLSLRLCSPA